MEGSGSPRTSCGPRSTTAMTRRSRSGTAWSGSRSTASNAVTPRTTTGRWACPGPAAPVRRSTTTAGRSTGSRVALSPTRTATSRSGTSCSCSTSSPRSAPSSTSTSGVTCRRRTSTPAWGSSAWRPCSRVSRTSTRSTRPGSSSIERSSCRGRGTAPTTTTTYGCASWPTTPARWPSSSRTASCPATRGAAMSYDASCVGLCATCACSVPVTPSWRS